MPIHLDAPQERDGKYVFVSSPSQEGWMTWITSRGDDLGNQKRGEGTKMVVDMAGPGTGFFELEFMDPVEIHDGQFNWDSTLWSEQDEFSLSALMPATQLTPNPGAGNVNVVSGILVPAAGNGSHDISFSQAVPVPAPGNTGFWDVDRVTGWLTVSAKPGQAEWHLIPAEIKSYFLRNLCMGSPLGVFDVDVYKAEWLSQRWKIRVDMTRVSLGPAKASGWLMLFREKST